MLIVMKKKLGFIQNCGKLAARYPIIHRQSFSLNKYSQLKILYPFSQLPKSSKFSKNLGLQSEFQKIVQQTQKQQRNKVRSFSLIIGLLCSVFGSIMFLLFIYPEQRDKISIILSYLTIYLNKKNMAEVFIKIKQFQQKYYRSLPYSDKTINYLMHRLLRKNQNYSQQVQRLILEVLTNNTKNLAGFKNLNSEQQALDTSKIDKIYQFYLEHILLYNLEKLLEDNYTKQNLKILLKHCVTIGSLQTYFLIARILNKMKSQNQNQIKNIKAFVNTLAEKTQLCLQNIEKGQQKLKEIQTVQSQVSIEPKNIQSGFMKQTLNRQKTLLDQYKYNYMLQKKWIIFIKKVIFDISSS